MSSPDDPAGDGGVVGALEEHLLGERPQYTQEQVAELAGVPVPAARELWNLLGFAHVPDDAAAFTEADVQALRLTKDLVALGILSPDRQSSLVRTWGRSFARLADWQVALLADVAVETGVDPTDGLLGLSGQVMPLVEDLQSYVWRRHLTSAASRMLAETSSGPTTMLAVCFVDIVGYTSRSRTLSDRELVTWLEDFESAVLTLAVDHGGRIIKNIGDELLIVADDPAAMAAIAAELTRRGADPDDPFPAVRAGLAYGDVVTRLGDVFGPTVNIAARLTSVARPSTVLIDEGAYEALSGRTGGSDAASASGASGSSGSSGDSGDSGDINAGDINTGDHRSDDVADPASAYRFRRLRRVSVKGYSRLHVWALQPR